LVDVGAVGAADVDDAELAVFTVEFGMAAADCDVVEEEAAGWVAVGG
jgi:hypothetical protein